MLRQAILWMESFIRRRITCFAIVSAGKQETNGNNTTSSISLFFLPEDYCRGGV